MKKSTHNGTCQACGKQHAFFKGTVAKHGYDVTHGFFNGVCFGAENVPAEVSVDITRRTMADLTVAAEAYQAEANELKAGKVIVTYTKLKYVGRKAEGSDSSGHIRVTMVFAQQDEYTQKYVRDQMVRDAQSCCDMRLAHVSFLERFVIPRLGMPLYVRDLSVPKNFKSGDKVKLADGSEVTLTEPAYNYHSRHVGWKFEGGRGYLTMVSLRKFNA